MNAQALTDDALLARIDELCSESARTLASLLKDLIDVEERRLHLKAACPSMYEFCMQRFKMSPSQAWRRTTAARLVQRFPILFDYVRRGEIDLSTLVLLRNFITEENADELIRATRCRTKRQVQRLLDTREPRPDAAARLKRRAHRGAANDESALLDRLDALSDDLHLLEVMLRKKTRQLIERSRDLLRHVNPSGNLADLVHRAFASLVEGLEALIDEASGKQAKKRLRPLAKTHHLPRAVRAAVLARDGFQCTFTSDTGHRCSGNRRLEVDHIVPRALGGSDDLENLRAVCRGHNRLYAEAIFGKEFIVTCIRERRAKAGASRA